jgi:hypothetical protein
VELKQLYHNTSSAPIEALYLFPLEEKAAIVGFEADINVRVSFGMSPLCGSPHDPFFEQGKKVVGKVKGKEKARAEYTAAIAKVTYLPGSNWI